MCCFGRGVFTDKAFAGPSAIGKTSADLKEAKKGPLILQLPNHFVEPWLKNGFNKFSYAALRHNFA